MILGKIINFGALIIHYIACDSTAYIYVSDDGLGWIQITPTGVSASYIYCAYYAGTTWYLGTSGGLYYSADGYSWTSHSTPLTSIYSITYDGTNYLIAGTGASYDVAVSSSMTGTFTGASNPFTNNASWICANTTGTVFATGSGTYTFLRRISGVWYFTNDAFSTRANGIVWHVDKFVAVGIGGNTLAYSNGSGVVWTGLGTTVIGTEGLCIASNGTYVVAGGYSTASKDIHWSTDGVTWSTTALMTGYVSAIFWDGSRFILVASGSFIYTSTNGYQWTNQYKQIPSSGDIRSIYSDTL